MLDVEIFGGIDKLPHFNPDLDQENLPVLIKDFRNRFQMAAGVPIYTSEYVFSLAGSLKKAIEWNVSTTNFSNKPVAIIVAAASGEKAFESLALVLTTIEARILEQSKLLIKGAKGKVGMDGVIQDQDTIASIKALVESFIKSIQAENQLPTKYT